MWKLCNEKMESLAEFSTLKDAKAAAAVRAYNEKILFFVCNPQGQVVAGFYPQGASYASN